jgi:hypothetical protein
MEHTCRFQEEEEKKKKSLPTDPNFEDYAIGNTHIFFFGLSGEAPNTNFIWSLA